MGFCEFSLALPADYTEEQLKNEILQQTGLKDFSYQILSKSLDARNKKNIHWVLRMQAVSPALPGELPKTEKLTLKKISPPVSVAVAGSGPAGFFAAYTLLSAGFKVNLIEQGAPVEERVSHIENFEKTGKLNPVSNYAFGEGGAGTFSDGKLTSRTKNIEKEKQFFLETFVKAGAPEEILYLAHPHVGSDRLQTVVKNLRLKFLEMGGKVFFHHTVKSLEKQESKIKAFVSEQREFPAEEFIMAPGHSHSPTFKMLIKKGVRFRHKGFAIGMRAEHPQELINRAQWGASGLCGVKAAEYRLACQNPGFLPVYTFCMCPGGKVVPAAPLEGLSVVNGVSDYQRNSPFANAAVVAGFNLPNLLQKEISVLESLSWLENLEKSFFSLKNSYAVPAVRIKDFIKNRNSASLPDSSFAFNLFSHDFKGLLPDTARNSIQAGLKTFSEKLRGYDEGILLGLESKTSSPIQAEREKNGRCTGFDNLYLIGEGSGYAGGITSSAVDGIKTALSLIEKYA